MMFVALEHQLELVSLLLLGCAYLELLIESLSMLAPNADSVNSTIPGAISPIGNIGAI